MLRPTGGSTQGLRNMSGRYRVASKVKLPEAGTYFDLVLNQKVPVERAMVQAFDMSPAQMEDAVKEHFKSLSGLGIALDQAKKPNVDPVNMPQPDHFALPFNGDDIGMTASPVKDEEARAMIGNVMAPVQEHRDQALRDLQQLAADPKGDEAGRRRSGGDDL